MYKCKNCPLHRFDYFDEFSQEDVELTQSCKAGEMRIEAGTPLLAQGAKSPQLFTVLSGMGVRYRTLEDGQRQVVNFVYPGDFLGLQAAVMEEMKHSVEATTDMHLCVFDRKVLWKIYRSSPERGFDLTWLAAVEEHMVAEALTSVGQQTALERISWALLRLYNRACAVGLADEAGVVPLPFRQQDLADAMGLSLVHTNKTLAKLRSDNIADWSDGRLQLMDRAKLADLAGTDADLEKRPLI